MAFIIGKIRCYFCEKKKGLFHSVHDHGIYGDVGRRIFYHPECHEMVTTFPERHGHRLVDKAINIHDLKKANIKKYNSKIRENIEKKIDKLHRYHFERMMPKP